MTIISGERGMHKNGQLFFFVSSLKATEESLMAENYHRDQGPERRRKIWAVCYLQKGPIAL